MSSNFLLSAPSGTSPALTNQQPSTARTRAISVCSTPGLPVRPHYPTTFSQSYPPISAIDASWTPMHHGVYVNGVGKVVNVFPNGTVSDLEDVPINQSGESFKYSNLKHSGVNPQAAGHGYPQQHSGYSVTNQPAQMHFALAAAAPNGLPQPQGTSLNHLVNPLRVDSSGLIPSPASHQNSTPGQQLFVPGMIGQQAFQHHSSVSPSVYPDLSRMGNSAHIVAASGTVKQVPSTNDSLSTRTGIPSHPSAGTYPPPNIPLAQHPGLSHHLYSPTAMQHQASHISPAMQPGVIEFVPSVYAPADMNPQASFTLPPSTSAMYGQFQGPQIPSYDANAVTFEGRFATRVRHNTWGGLESELTSQSIGSPYNNEKAVVVGGPLGEGDQNSPCQLRDPADHMVTQFPPVSHTFNNLQTDYSSPHRSGVNESLGEHNTSELPRDVSVYGANTPKRENPDPVRDRNSQWSNPPSQPDGCPRFPPSLAEGSVYDNTYILARDASTGCRSQNALSKEDDVLNDKNIDFQRLQHQTGRYQQTRSRFLQSGPTMSRKSGQSIGSRPLSRHKALPNRAMQVASSPSPNLTSIPSHPRSPWRPLSLFQNNFVPSPDQATLQDLPSNWPRVPLSLMNTLPYNLPRPPFENFTYPADLLRSFAPILKPAWNLSAEPKELRPILDLCPLRVLISTALVGAIIGRGGRTIRSITAETGAVIEFKPVTLAFCQFSISNASRHSAAGNTSKPEQTTESNQTSSTPGSPKPTTTGATTSERSTATFDQQYGRSQVLFISGTREQCSAALSEILSICFRESEHRGLAAPCLGLLVQNSIYNLLLMNRGRAYFNSIRAATGVRITVTSPTLCSSTEAVSDVDRPNQPKSVTSATGDRILVIHGPLRTIFTAEALLSDELRSAAAEFLISPTIWRLLPLLPLEAFTSMTRSKIDSPWSRGLQHLNRMTLHLAEVYWPHGVCTRLARHPSLHEAYQDALRALFQLDMPEGVNGTGARRLKSTRSETAASESKESVVLDAQPDSEETAQAIHQNETNGESFVAASSTAEPDLIPIQDTVETNDVEKSESLEEPTAPDNPDPIVSETPPDVGDFPNSTLTAATIQQAVLSLLGSITWLATSGVLYMRVSYNEAGVLIGAGGCRIQQLIQSTGAQIHVNKTPINEPYALAQARHQLVPDSATDEAQSVDPQLTSDTADTASTLPKGDTEVNVTTPIASRDHSADDTTEPPPADELPPSDEVVEESGVVQESQVPDSACSVPAQANSEDKQLPDSGPLTATHRLVTLSGSHQSQLLALWRIFQRLKFVHNRGASSEVQEKTTNSPSDQPIGTGQPFRLATLVCLPYRFVCWLTSNNAKFAELMSSTEHGDVATPLQWLQSVTSWNATDSSGQTVTLKAVHLLPEPKRRWRLIRQQLRRSTAARRDGIYEEAKPIVLPSGSLSNDGLDSLWSDPNSVPLEIYADYETTQVTLSHLHQMLTVWLYGQALVHSTTQPDHLVPAQAAMFPFAPRPPLFYPFDQFGFRPPPAAQPDPSARLSGCSNWAMSSPWPGQFRARLGGPYVTGVDLSNLPDLYGRSPRPRFPFYAPRWPLMNSPRVSSITPNLDPTAFHHRPPFSHQPSTLNSWSPRFLVTQESLLNSLQRPVDPYDPRYSSPLIWNSFTNKSTQPPRRQTGFGNRSGRRPQTTNVPPRSSQPTEESVEATTETEKVAEEQGTT